MSSNYDKLIKEVLDKSESKNWTDAVKEWEIIDCEEDENVPPTAFVEKKGLDIYSQSKIR